MKALRRWPYLSVLCLLLLTFLSLAPAAHAQLYSETFNNSGGSNLMTATSSWYTYAGATATNLSNYMPATNTISNTVDYAGISNANGNPKDTKGYLFFVNNATPAQTFGSVHTFGTGLTLANGDSITWTMGNNKTTATVRLLLQIGGDGSIGSGTWVASNSTKNNSTAYVTAASYSDAQTSDVTFSVNYSSTASNWSAFTLDPTGGSMSLGSTLSSDLSSSTITGIGFYVVDSSASVVRIDTLQIIPEPTSIALLVFSFGTLLLGSGRRTRRT
ncbi:MAG: hypothetical protein B9S32_17460 [Verrucomicrobia bacterium Tous-C9LFEB]|nr:MAG: hypothetical protein B9S32_17460 [Verrucomicrobia bacterium Tous-C9LFEB]